MKKVKKPVLFTEKKSFDIFDRPWTHYMMIGLLFVVFIAMYYQIAILHYSPKPHDTQQFRMSARQVIDYNKNNPDTALWTDSMFSGMPNYLLAFPLKFPSLSYLHRAFYINWRIFALIFGAVGMYILLVRMKFSPLIALFGAFAFGLSCHFVGLIDIGHNTKIRAIMYIPWIFMSFEEIRKHKHILAVGLFALFTIDQLRENHFQITYYTFLMLGMYWLAYLIKAIRERTYRDYAIFTGLVMLGFFIAILAVANPYLSTYEYSHYTIRGGGTGLTTVYATNWSFGIGEVFSFIVPYIYGGVSPEYWGPMGTLGSSMTQTFMYMGILIFYLAIIGGIFEFKRLKVKVLLIISFIVLLMSFGRHFPQFSNLLLSYFPLWNKFRVPAMILAIMQFCFPILAAYGLKFCIDKINANDYRFNQTLFYSMLGCIGMVILFYAGEGVFESMSFIGKGEEARYLAQYTPEQTSYILAQLKTMRLDLLLKSGMQSFGILFGGTLLLWLMVKGFVKKNIILILLIALTILDLGLINTKNHLKKEKLVEEKVMLNEFVNMKIDNIIRQDSLDVFRIYPFHEFDNARWAYHHQSIGGYHGAKLSRYQDILDNCLKFPIDGIVPINWNIINMLNVKYLILNERWLPLTNLKHITEVYLEIIDRNTHYLLYENKNYLPRGWFVKDSELITDKKSIFNRLIDSSFNPRESVIVEQAVPEFSYSDDFELELLSRDIHHATWQSKNDSTAFMVISEIYYPAGWNVYINDVKTEIYPANYILRGIIVPAGENLIEMKFEPTSYKVSIRLSAIGLLTALLLTLLGIVKYYRDNYGKGIVYKIKM